MVIFFVKNVKLYWKDMETKINKYIDHTIVSRDATKAQINKVIGEAKEYDFATVCITPTWTKYVSSQLEGTTVGTTVVIGFPFGTSSTATKVFEAKEAIQNGATELDFVVNIGMVHDRETDYLVKELAELRAATVGTVIKMIIETGELNGSEEIAYITELTAAAGFDFVKTSTGIATTGATLEDVKLMKETINGRSKIKASGGVRTLTDAKAMIEAGADRIGTSNGISIIEGTVATEEY